jgi:hypothetical protein
MLLVGIVNLRTVAVFAGEGGICLTLGLRPTTNVEVHGRQICNNPTEISLNTVWSQLGTLVVEGGTYLSAMNSSTNAPEFVSVASLKRRSRRMATYM